MTDRELLERIAAIENKLHGGDWDEIEEARAIARAALAAASQTEADELRERLSQLANEMVYEGNSVSFIYQKMRAYRAAIDEAWQALLEAGFPPDGNTAVSDKIRAALAAPAEPPAGWVLVPVEPTQEMLQAAHDWAGNQLSKPCYRAMLAAAPKQEQT